MRHDPIDPAQLGVLEKAAFAWPPPAIRVQELMSRPVVTIRADAGWEEAWRLMGARKIRHLPVVDAAGTLVGIVTDRDLGQLAADPEARGAELDLGAAPSPVTVGRVMTWGVVTARPETEIREAARLMYEQRIGALPVVQDDRVVGILTASDLIRHLS